MALETSVFYETWWSLKKELIKQNPDVAQFFFKGYQGNRIFQWLKLCKRNNAMKLRLHKLKQGLGKKKLMPLRKAQKICLLEENLRQFLFIVFFSYKVFIHYHHHKKSCSKRIQFHCHWQITQAKNSSWSGNINLHNVSIWMASKLLHHVWVTHFSQCMSHPF